MKKKILLAVIFSLALAAQNQVSAQKTESVDLKGANFVNAGIGLGSYGLYGTGGFPLTASYEHGFTKNISAGVSLGFIQRNYVDDWKYTYLIFSARGSYHFNDVLKISNPRVDVYGGAGLVYRHYKYKYMEQDTDAGYTQYNASGSSMDIEFHAGARYLFSNHIGAYAELGYGISPLQLGLTFKF